MVRLRIDQPCGDPSDVERLVQAASFSPVAHLSLGPLVSYRVSVLVLQVDPR
jgi:hypothetical protein